MNLVSKPSVLLNLLQALFAIILGNVAYFLLAPLSHYRATNRSRLMSDCSSISSFASSPIG
jgi:hypothetical protein